MHNCFYIKIVSFLLLIAAGPVLKAQPRAVPATYGAINKSYVRTWNATAPEQTPNTLTTRVIRDVKQTTQYVDGLGRPLQTVARQGSYPTNGTAVDMINMVEYDVYGRELFKYLPTPANNTGGNTSITDGNFKTNPFAEQATFYGDNTNGPIKSQGETFYYGQTNFENSPLNRLQETAAPGNSWTGTMWNTTEASRRSVKMKYYVNTSTDAVRIWNVTVVSAAGSSFSTYSSPGAYAAGLLLKTISMDETGNQVIEFKDKEGKVILKKVQLTSLPDDGTTGKDHTGWLCTYYLYDDLNNLRCVIQPKGVELISTLSWALTDATILAEQCFRYEYDARLRMIIKKVPGADPVYMVYDIRDRLVMTQDGNLRNAQPYPKFLYTLYDNLNRPVQTGTISTVGLWTDHLANAAASTNYPVVNNYINETFTITNYDNYNGIPGGLTSTFDATWATYFSSTYNTSPQYAQQQTASQQLNGALAWSQAKILGTASTFLYTVNIYDAKGRLIQVKTTNVTGGTDILTTQYNWAGQPIIMVLKQEKAGVPAQTTVTVTQNTYDDLGRLVQVDKKVQNTNVNANAMSAYTTIVKNEYDALGQLKKKNTGNKPGSPGSPLAKMEYQYNVRGWPLSVNKDYVTASSNSDQYFGFELGYDKNPVTLGSWTGLQYNGNITGTLWKSEGDQQQRKYDFTYDAVNRLTAGNFTQYASGSGSSAVFNTSAGIDFSTTGLTYDANGNILTMAQKGLKVSGSSIVDNLRYTYSDKSNKLKSVTDFNNDAATKLGDFKTNTTHPQNAAKAALTASSPQSSFDAITDYTYDVNGNLALDNNKSISGITYNHLNLPLVITTTKGTITYTYDAAGNKLSKTTSETGASVTNNGTTYTGVNITTVTLYIGSSVYESKQYTNNSTLNAALGYTDKLLFIAHEEGRIRYEPATTSTCTAMPNRLIYDYFIKDHLGNVRLLLTEQNEAVCYIPATVEDATYQNEQKIYDIVDGRRVLRSTVGAPQTSFQNKLYQTHGGIAGQKTGLGATLKVMAGDNVKIFAESYYTLPSGGNPGSPLNMALSDLLAAFAGSSAVSTVKGSVTATDVQNLGTNNSQISSFITRTPGSYTAKAYVNWILFDDQLKYVSSGADPVGTGTSGGGGVYKAHSTFASPGITITKSGFFYVFVSNESNLAVFFDNLTLTHTPGPILEETHYYPFGLVMQGISSKALKSNYAENKYKFNAGTELANKEFSDGSGLELYETPFRGYDAQIGRFWQIDAMSSVYESFSPYSFGVNNPISLNDPTGLDPETSTEEHPKELAEVVVVSSYKNKWTYPIWLNYAEQLRAHGKDNIQMNSVLRSQGVDDRGMRLFNQAFNDLPYWDRYWQAEREWRAFIQAALLEGATWAAGGLVFKVGGKLVTVGYRAYKLAKLRKAEKGFEFLYHYTSEAAAKSISETGLKVGKDGFSYLTNNGTLSPLQAQIELALPANRALPTSILKIDVTGLDPALIRRVTGNLPGMGAGGGTEFLFTETIPSNLIQIVK